MVRGGAREGEETGVAPARVRPCRLVCASPPASARTLLATLWKAVEMLITNSNSKARATPRTIGTVRLPPDGATAWLAGAADAMGAGTIHERAPASMGRERNAPVAPVSDLSWPWPGRDGGGGTGMESCWSRWQTENGGGTMRMIHWMPTRSRICLQSAGGQFVRPAAYPREIGCLQDF